MSLLVVRVVSLGGGEAWLGLLLESRANPGCIGRNVCVPNKLRQPCKRWRFSGVLHCPENGHKNDQTWQWLCKGGGGALFLSYIACVFHFWPFFFLFLTARPIGVQPPPQLLHFRYPNHQRQIDTGVCVWHRYGQLVSTADCYYYLCIPLNVTKGEEGRAKRKGRPTKREDKWLERTIRRAFRPSCQGSL
jgi:hypothetical protein